MQKAQKNKPINPAESTTMLTRIYSGIYPPPTRYSTAFPEHLSKPFSLIFRNPGHNLSATTLPRPCEALSRHCEVPSRPCETLSRHCEVRSNLRRVPARLPRSARKDDTRIKHFKHTHRRAYITNPHAHITNLHAYITNPHAYIINPHVYTINLRAYIDNPHVYTTNPRAYIDNLRAYIDNTHVYIDGRNKNITDYLSL